MSSIRARRALHLIAFASLAGASATRAQVTRSEVSITAGSGTDTRGVTTGALTIAPAVTFSPSARSAYSLGASATRFGDAGWSLGANSGMTASRALASRGSIEVGLSMDAALAAARTSYSTNFAGIDVTPSLYGKVRSMLAFAGLHGAASTSMNPSSTSTLPGMPVRSTSTAFSASSTGLVLGGGIRGAVLENGSLLDLLYRESHDHTGTDQWRDRALTLGVSGRAASLAASLGARSAANERLTFGSATLVAPIGDHLAFSAAAGRYPSNRLSGVAGGSFATAGLTFRTGAAHARAVADEPAGVSAPARGATRLAIRAPRASRVDVAGSWNGWTPTPARRASNGVWYVDLALAPGSWRYAFKVDGSTWTVPDGVAADDDGYGARSALIVVRN